MFKPLPVDFSLSMYGLDVRLVDDRDTDFILTLRTNKVLSKNIHETENDVSKHLEWLSKYKQREAEGRDYYFIYFKEGKPIGLNRIYNIHEYYGTPGSWLCSPENDPTTTLSTYFIARKIYFDILGLNLLVYDVRKANKKVYKLHKMLGAQIVGESDIDYYLVMTKENYLLHRDKFLKNLGLI